MNKKHIINEIIRTAKDNNGKPLGKERFEKETGIRQSDWYGKYWAKWSDVVIEAGFNPNKMNLAYTEEYIIEHLISLIKEIKRVPTMGDLRLKAYNSKGFPSHNTFNKFGNKSTLIKRTIEYCNDRPQYQDIVEICKKAFKQKIASSEITNIALGYVYLMKSGRYYKIGKADCVEKRNYEIGIKLPEESKIIHKIKTDDPFGIEAYWHKRFENKRKQGEWFNLSASDVKAFKKWKRIA